MMQRVSDELLAQALASLPPDTEYLSDLDRLALDLRDARAALVRMGYAEDASRQLEIARAALAKCEADAAAMREALEEAVRVASYGRLITLSGVPISVECQVGTASIDRWRAALAASGEKDGGRP